VKAGTKEELHHLREQILASPRNDSWFDIWSAGHLTLGIAMGWLMDPFVALFLLVVWEPFEVLLLSPWLAKRGIEFGRETLRNSLSDIFFDAIGVAGGFWALTPWLPPPFRLF
jgi:hypothetical protein